MVTDVVEERPVSFYRVHLSKKSQLLFLGVDCEDGGSKLLRNLGQNLPVEKA